MSDHGAAATYKEEEEIEITDGEYKVEKEEPEKRALSLKPRTPRSSSGTPGKVEPSKQVKDMKLKSPEALARSPLPTNKNPFPIFGAWTEATMSEIEIIVPVLTGKNESTNELTRESKPEARYWKAPIVFKHDNFTSTTLRFDNVPIPYHTGKGYGSNFIYLCLPGFAADKFAETGKTRRPAVVTEKSLQADKNRWWKVANGVNESFGVINSETKKFHKKSLETIFDGTNSGVTATVILSFSVKASTDSKEPLKPTTSSSISIVLERAYLEDTDLNVQMLVRINTKKQRSEPSATVRDIASEKLMKRLAELGL